MWGTTPWWCRHRSSHRIALMGDPPISGGFSIQRALVRSFDLFFVIHLNTFWTNSWDAHVTFMWRHCIDTRLVHALQWRFNWSVFEVRTCMSNCISQFYVAAFSYPCPKVNFALSNWARLVKETLGFGSLSQFLKMIKTLVTGMISRWYLTGVSAAELWRHLTNMNMIESI